MLETAQKNAGRPYPDALVNRFVLDISKLKDGDVIVEHGYSTYSPTIEKVTKCYYTHAMIYLEGTIIEATSDGGVFSRVPNRIAVPLEKDLVVLRLKNSLDPYIMNLITSRARELIGSSYSITEAASTQIYKNTPAKKVNIKIKPKRSQFCSRLVAQCYSYGGVNIVDNIDYCTPKDIFNSIYLQPVHNAIKEGSSEEIYHANIGELHPKHLKSCVAWVKTAKKILAKHDVKVQTINEIIHAVVKLNNTKVDKAVFKAINDSGYLQDYVDDRIQNEYRYNIVMFLDFYKKQQISIEMEIEKEFGIYKTRKSNFQTYKDMYEEHPARIIKCHLDLEKKLLKSIHERLTIILTVCQMLALTPKNIAKAKEIFIDIKFLLE
ncbi:TPA: YiiX/YebB-like N1pC/P60 family cysteine hydrolase [Escherichia coli]